MSERRYSNGEILQVSKGRLRKYFRLTPREIEVVGLIVDGATKNADLAERMGIREQTVKNLVGSIFEKAGNVTKRKPKRKAGLVAQLVEQGVITSTLR